MMQDWLARVEARLEEILPGEGGPPRELHAAMRYAVFPGGKRLRPLLVMAAAHLRGRASEAVDAACAAELVHSYSLVHDDLPCMDDDDLRRGRPSCHRVFGQVVALLAGNALLSLGFEVLASYPGDLSRRLVRELARACGPQGLAGGQVGDLLWEVGEENYLFVTGAKTAALFRACLRMGGLVAGLDPDTMALLDRCGLHLGMAFQIRDDLADRRTGPMEAARGPAGAGPMAEQPAGGGRAGGRPAGMSAVAVWGEEGARARAREEARALGDTLRLLGARNAMLRYVTELAVGPSGDSSPPDAGRV